MLVPLYILAVTTFCETLWCSLACGVHLLVVFTSLLFHCLEITPVHRESEGAHEYGHM